MAIFSDHETVAQFTLGLVGISLIFLGYLLFRVREISMDIDCLHSAYHEAIDAYDDDDSEQLLFGEMDLADYILEFADHLGIPTYKKDESIGHEADNNTSEVSDWDSGQV